MRKTRCKACRSSCRTHTPFCIGRLASELPGAPKWYITIQALKACPQSGRGTCNACNKRAVEQNGLQVYTDMRLSRDAYQRLINLMTHMWDADMEDMVRLVLPRRASMYKWPAVATMLARQASGRVECRGVAVIRRHGVHNTKCITSVAATFTEIVEGRTDSAWGGFAGASEFLLSKIKPSNHF